MIPTHLSSPVLPSLAPSKGRVLCVDDEPNVLRALSWLLRRDFEVVTVASARDALGLIHQGDFDVVVSDQRMPEMNGVEFLTQVKVMAPRAMRILLTGYSDMQAVLQSVNEAEVFRFVNKPWDVLELPLIIAQAAEIARQLEAPPLTEIVAHPEVAGERLPKILVLDEDEATYSAVELSVGDLAQIVHVTSPADAFRLLEDEEIGIILSERKLGTMDLTQLLCLLKRKHPQIVSIIVTESDDSNLICRMINQGQIYRFISKPLKAGNLRIALKSAIAKRSELLENPLLLGRHQVPEMSRDDTVRLENSMLFQVDGNNPEEHKVRQQDGVINKLGSFFRRLLAS